MENRYWKDSTETTINKTPPDLSNIRKWKWLSHIAGFADSSWNNLKVIAQEEKKIPAPKKLGFPKGDCNAEGKEVLEKTRAQTSFAVISLKKSQLDLQLAVFILTSQKWPYLNKGYIKRHNCFTANVLL